MSHLTKCQEGEIFARGGKPKKGPHEEKIPKRLPLGEKAPPKD